MAICSIKVKATRTDEGQLTVNTFEPKTDVRGLQTGDRAIYTYEQGKLRPWDPGDVGLLPGTIVRIGIAKEAGVFYADGDRLEELNIPSAPSATNGKIEKSRFGTVEADQPLYEIQETGGEACYHTATKEIPDQGAKEGQRVEYKVKEEEDGIEHISEIVKVLDLQTIGQNEVAPKRAVSPKTEQPAS